MLVIGDVGRRQLGRQRDPHGRDSGHQMQLPAIDPPVPARFGPGAPRYRSRCAAPRQLPDPSCARRRRAPARRCYRCAAAAHTSPTAGAGRPSGRPRQPICAGKRRPAWPGGAAPRCGGRESGRPPSADRAGVCISAVGCASTLSSSCTVCRCRTIIITKRLQKQAIRVGLAGDHVHALPGGGGTGMRPDQLDQRDKQRLVFYHGGYLRVVDRCGNHHDAAVAA